MSAVKRSFSGSPVEMLTVLLTIAKQAQEHKEPFQELLDTFANPYFEDLEKRIEAIITQYFGKDAAKKLREATALLAAMHTLAYKDLSKFKLLLEERFKTDKAFIASTLNSLGFQDHYEDVQNKSQEALVSLLFQFKQNLDENLKAKIVQSGLKTSLLEGIIARADDLKNANVTQEVFKSNRKTDTQEALTQFNTIYGEVISLSKLATKAFQGDKALIDKFNYTKNLKALTGAASAGTMAKKAKAAKALQTS